MRIKHVETLHADGGWRVISYLRLETEDGLVGWSEFSEAPWSAGLTGVIAALAAQIIGKDPRAFARLSTDLRNGTRLAGGGLAAQAIAAIENACIDLAAKSFGVPVFRLFGGPYRERIPLYWSHCGTFRVVYADFFDTVIGTPPLRSIEDFAVLGRDVKEKGFSALKTNPISFAGGVARMCNPGFVPDANFDYAGSGDSFPIADVAAQIEALRRGAGPAAKIMLDLNFSLSGDGLLRIARELDALHLHWMEIDARNPRALAEVRSKINTPIASCESLHGIDQYRPFLDARAADVAIVDVIWNGLLESMRIATLADANATNVAPHNFYGHLATFMSAHFFAAVPNGAIMEIEVDDAPWHGDLVTAKPVIQDGALVLSDSPGWGCDVNEAAVRAHPAPTRTS